MVILVELQRNLIERIESKLLKRASFTNVSQNLIERIERIFSSPYHTKPYRGIS